MTCKLSAWVFCACAGFLSLGCATTVSAAGGVRKPAAVEPPADAARPVSALAIEHYLRAQLYVRDNKLREAVFELRQALTYDNSSSYLHTRLGRLYALLGLWRGVRDEAKAALQLDDKNVDAVLLEGLAFLRAGKKDKAIESYERAVSIDTHKIEAYISLAQLYLEQGAKDKALHTLTQMTAANPSSAEGFSKLAGLYFERGDEKKAESCYRRALQLDPSDTRTIEILAGLLEQQGRYKEAITVFEDAMESNPEYPRYMAYMAALYIKAGDKQTGDAYFAQLRALDPKNARLIAYEYSRLSMHEEAIRELTALLKKNPNLHSERLLLAIMLEQRKQWEKAIVELRKIPENSRLIVNAKINLGYCLRHTRKFPEAIEILNKALTMTHDRDNIGRIYGTLADIYGETKEFKQGIRLLNQAIKKNPNNLDLVEAKANLLYTAKLGQQGVMVLKKALTKSPRDVSLLYSLGALYEQMGRVKESLDIMRQVIEIEPNNYSALNFIGYTMADQGQDLDQAERLIRRALLLDPGNGAITDSLGWVLYRKQEYKKALDYLIRATRVSPGEPVIIMHVGDAYLKLGRRAEAIEQYKKALAANPEERDRKQIIDRLKKLGIDPGPVKKPADP
jgi:tetratricopeptide (TPR) repeat protein